VHGTAEGVPRWTCYHLYVILDVFSRFVVGWMIAYRESAELAPIDLACYSWQTHCRGLYQTQIAA
jgi:hypothetical protein